MASTSRRRRVSSAVPSSEEAQQAAATHAGGKKAPTAAAAAQQAHDDTDNHHVPRLLLPFPRIPWHRPKPQQPATTTAAAWTRLPSSPEYYHRDHHQHHRTLLSRSEAPSYLTGNPFVLHGFRRCASLWEAVDGLWFMHNAFWDAWTSIASFVHSHM